MSWGTWIWGVSAAIHGRVWAGDRVLESSTCMHVPGKRAAYWALLSGVCRLTNRKIHDASEMLPKTPDSASWAVRSGPWPTTVTFIVFGCKRVSGREGSGEVV